MCKCDLSLSAIMDSVGIWKEVHPSSFTWPYNGTKETLSRDLRVKLNTKIRFSLNTNREFSDLQLLNQVIDSMASSSAHKPPGDQ